MAILFNRNVIILYLPENEECLCNWASSIRINKLRPILYIENRSLDIADLIPQKNPESDVRILKPEFKNILSKLGFPMGSEEFEKLWQR